MVKKKILVCGATGFIGRNIAERLAKDMGLEIYGTYFRSRPLEDPRIKMVKADLTRAEDADKAVKGMDIVIQAAAATAGIKAVMTNPHRYVADNAVMNSLIFRACHEYDVSRLLFFSCTVMYQSSGMPLKETDFDPNKDICRPYFGIGWTKVYLEKMSEFYSAMGRTKYTIIRHSNIYGPHDNFDPDRSHVFGATIAKVVACQDGKVVVWGGGEEKRDLLYVSDLLDFVTAAMNRQEARFEIYNAGYGKSVSVKELVRKIIISSGKDIRVIYEPDKPTVKTEIFLDISKAGNSLGWTPHVSLDEGIKKILSWYISRKITKGLYE